jgi:hypothetical protein
VRQRASERFAAASDAELCFYLVNAERYPAVRPYARELATAVLAGVAQLLEGDPVLGAVSAPPYSERGVAEMVAETHARNVAQRRRGERDPWADLHAARAPIEDILDGFWLQGFADVTRIHLEEYGWLFRIYASEMGDGQLGWNHNAIARSGMVREVGAAAALALTDPRLYDAFSIRLPTLALLAMSVNTQHFLPEILGVNLALEATGVGGWYQTMWKRAQREGDRWQALYFRLHNSIDNYASGHTSWSIAAVQAFMTRVREAAPQAVEEQWRRIWRLWRLREIEMHGSDAERAALASAFERAPGR